MYPEIQNKTQFLVHPACATWGETIDDNQIARCIQSLRAPDINQRVDACNVLRCVPRDSLERVWARERPNVGAAIGWGEDCLRRMEIEFPADSHCERAAISVCSPGYERYLRLAIESFQARANSPEARIFVFAVNESYDEIKSWPGVTAVRCRSTEPLSAAVKGTIYSAASFLDAQSFVSFEADMLFLDDLQPLWQTIENSHETTIWGCRSQTRGNRYGMREVLHHSRAPVSDLEWLTGRPGSDSLFWYNGGLIAGQRAAWQDLEARIRGMGAPALAYADGGFQASHRDEFIFNVAVGLMENRAELSGAWNCQIIDENHEHWMKTERDGSYSRLDERVKIAHFIGKQRPYMDAVATKIGINHAT